LGPVLIPVYRQSARRWREVDHAIDLAVGCHYFLPGLRLPPYLSPDGATCKRQHIYDSSLLLIYRLRKDERLSWLTCSGWFTHISGHPSAAGRAQNRESSPVRDRRFTTVPRYQLVHMTLSNIHNIAIDNHFCCVLVAYWKLGSERQYLSLHAYTLSCSLTCLASAYCGLGLEKKFGPRPHFFWPRPHAQLASLTSLPSVCFIRPPPCCKLADVAAADTRHRSIAAWPADSTQ